MHSPQASLAFRKDAFDPTTSSPDGPQALSLLALALFRPCFPSIQKLSSWKRNKALLKQFHGVGRCI